MTKTTSTPTDDGISSGQCYCCGESVDDVARELVKAPHRSFGNVHVHPACLRWYLDNPEEARKAGMAFRGGRDE